MEMRADDVPGHAMQIPVAEPAEAVDLQGVAAGALARR